VTLRISKSRRKVVFWNAVSDICCHDQDLISTSKPWQERWRHDKLAQFGRFYKVPRHWTLRWRHWSARCSDELLNALIAWVEQGIGTRSCGDPSRRRAQLLFADPKTGTVSGVVVPPSSADLVISCSVLIRLLAKFNGKVGGENDAVNWSCKPSTTAKVATR